PRSHTRRTQPHTATHNTPHTATEDLTPPPPPPLARCRRLTYAPPSSPSAPSPLSAPSPVRAGTIPAVAVRASRAVPVVPCPPRHRPLPCCGDGARDSGSRAAGCCGDGAREPPAGCCGDTAPSRELCCRACSRGSREDELHVPCLVCFRNVEVLDGSCGNIKFDGLVVDENPPGSAASNDGPTPGAEVDIATRLGRNLFGPDQPPQ
ncbi:unnamed protein product, partial [Urochloa humidicola]